MNKSIGTFGSGRLCELVCMVPRKNKVFQSMYQCSLEPFQVPRSSATCADESQVDPFPFSATSGCVALFNC